MGINKLGRRNLNLCLGVSHNVAMGTVHFIG